MTSTIEHTAASPPPRERIGLIGIGLVGTALVERLRGPTREIVGWDIAPERLAALTQLGGIAANSAVALVQSCDRILLSLPTLNVVEELMREVNTALRPGQNIIDTTTGAPDQAVDLANQLTKRGVTYLDATVSGSSAQVRAGEVTVMVGGRHEAFERCRDLFGAFAKKVIHTGPSGSGAKMKLVTNLVMGLNRAALAEGFVFARALGLDAGQTLSVLRETMAHSRVMDAKGEKMVRGDFEPQARLSQHLKDVRLMLETAAKTEAKLPLTETHRALLELAETLGFGTLDNSAVIRAIERWKRPS